MKYQIEEIGIAIDIPEDFKRLTSEDVKNMTGKSDKDEWVVKSDERHAIFDIVWKKIPFLSKNVAVSKTARATERRMKKRINGFAKINDTTRTVAGNDAAGFVYSYTAGNIDMKSEYLLIKYHGNFVAFSILSRAEGFDDNYKIFDDMIKNIEFVGRAKR